MHNAALLCGGARPLVVVRFMLEISYSLSSGIKRWRRILLLWRSVEVDALGPALKVTDMYENYRQPTWVRSPVRPMLMLLLIRTACYAT